MLNLIKRKNSPYWIARGTIKSRRIERSTGETSKAKAKVRLAEIVSEEQNRVIEPPKVKRSERWETMSFAAAMTAYVDHGKPTRFLDKLLDYFLVTPLEDIDNAMMTKAAKALYPHAQPATIRRQLYVPVNAIIEFVKDDKLRAPKGEGRRTDFITPEQAEALITATRSNRNPYLPAMVIFLLGQGVRTSELFSLDNSDLNLNAQYAIVREPKNGNERTLKLIPRVIRELSNLPTIGQEGPVFRKWNGEPYTPKQGRGGQIRNPFRAAVELAGLDGKKITPHIMRHTWATWHYAVNKDPLALKLAGGWESNEYQRYVKAAPDGLAESVNRHNWQFNGGKVGQIVEFRKVANK